MVHARIHWFNTSAASIDVCGPRKKSDSDAVIFVYKCILSLEHLTHPTLTYPPLNNIKHVTGKDKCSHRYLLQELIINKQYKSITNKSCCIPSLLKPYEEESKTQGFNRWKWSRSVNALTSHSKTFSCPVAWHNRSRDTQEPMAFHNQSWRKASSGGIFWIYAQRLAAHRKSFYGGRRRRSRLFLSQINGFASEDLEH